MEGRAGLAGLWLLDFPALAKCSGLFCCRYISDVISDVTSVLPSSPALQLCPPPEAPPPHQTHGCLGHCRGLCLPACLSLYQADHSHASFRYLIQCHFSGNAFQLPSRVENLPLHSLSFPRFNRSSQLFLKPDILYIYVVTYSELISPHWNYNYM